jgi:hypothetical protein
MPAAGDGRRGRGGDRRRRHVELGMRIVDAEGLRRRVRAGGDVAERVRAVRPARVGAEAEHLAAAGDESVHGVGPRDDERARLRLARDGAREVRRVGHRDAMRPVALHHVDARVRTDRREAPQLERHRPRCPEREALDARRAALGAERGERRAPDRDARRPAHARQRRDRPAATRE